VLLEAGASAQFITTGNSGALVNLAWKVNGVTGGSAASRDDHGVGHLHGAGVDSRRGGGNYGHQYGDERDNQSGTGDVFSPATFASGSVSQSNNPQVARDSETSPGGP
jgi:hypothetical protein